MFEAVAVIDHDLERRNRLYQVLTEVNFRVTTLPSFRELLDFLKRERPSCAILAANGPEGSIATDSALRSLRVIDKQLKVVLLVPAERVGGLDAALAADPRLTVINAGMETLALIQAILGVLREPEVERVGTQSTLKGSVLIIEDEARIAELFTEYLQRRGYAVTAVANGEKALLEMQVQRPKIVILDILLPGMDGLLALKRIKAMDPGVSVIVSSGFEDMGLITQAMALGASAYLIKPFNLSKLEAAILSTTVQRPASA